MRLTITKVGLTTVTWYATDKAGNAESPQHSESVLIASSSLGCAAPSPKFTLPASGSVTITGTLTVGGKSRHISITIKYGQSGTPTQAIDAPRRPVPMHQLRF